MSNSTAETLLEELPLQPTSLDVYKSKYQLTDEHNNVIDVDLNATRARVAKALASVEAPDLRVYYNELFLKTLMDGAAPAGRILSNAGAEGYKPGVSLINCVVSGTINDSITGIFTSLEEAAKSLAVGNGIGYEFSTIRPKGAFVSGVGAETGGALDFMDCFDVMCARISSAGGRRGAQMATFDVRHPEVVDFIKSKREDGKFRKFNLSVLITDDFIQAVTNDNLWEFSFPITKTRYKKDGDYIWRDFPTTDNYVVNDAGLVACERYGTMPAKELWDIIMQSTYDFSEPGFLLIDRMNEMNPLKSIEQIRATNPCGEQPLPEYGSCLLGSINLTRFVRKPFTPDAYFDFDAYTENVCIFHRMLDNVVEQHGLSIQRQIDEITNKRRHGMGYMGLGSAMVMLGMMYGDVKSLDFTSKVTRTLTVSGYKVGVALAKEKGRAPVFDDSDVLRDFVNSEFMQRVFKEEPKLESEMLQYGCRYTHCASIAPTGSISLSVSNNVSNGIESSFSHFYLRNIIKPGRKTKEQVGVYSYELLAYNHYMGREVPVDELPPEFMDSSEISAKQHIDVQAAAQYWVDSSISKTVTLPTDASMAEFKDTYLYAIESGLKGLSTFRFNPDVFQGVLVREDDLDATTYEFTLADGSTMLVSGNDTIMYDGAEHSAANLFDALKEGTYGKL